MKNLKKLSILKDMLVAAKDFRDPWNYFFDHFGDDPEFIRKVGRRAKEKGLIKVIAQVGRELFKKSTIAVSNLFLTEIPKYHFVHGSCFVEGRIATLMFFEDIDMGLIAVSMGGDLTMFARFSRSMVEGEHGEDVFVVPNAGGDTIN